MHGQGAGNLDDQTKTRMPQTRVALADQAERIANMCSWERDATLSSWSFISDHAMHLLAIQPQKILAGQFDFTANIHEGDRQRVCDTYASIIARPEPYALEYSYNVSNGELHYILESGEPVLDDNGIVCGFHGVMQDASVRKRFERDLIASQRRWRDAITLAHLGHWVWDEINNRYIYCSEELARMHGLPSIDELLTPGTWQQDANMWVHPEDREQYIREITKVEETESNWDLQYRIIRRDGEVRYIREIGDFIRDEHGKPTQSSGTMQDITENKLTEMALQNAKEAAEEANRAKTEFLSVVSHELRTPLTSISGSLAIVEGGIVGDIPEEAREMLVIAQRNAKRLNQLVNDILDVNKFVADDVQLSMEQIGVNELLESVYSDNQPFALQYDVTLNVAYPDKGLFVWGDRRRLEQVFSNLISNAVKFSTSGESVLLTAEHRGDKICFNVCDNGPGIPEDFRDQVFERFSQADSTDLRNQGGTGLGLTISKGIIEAHGGDISYETRGQGDLNIARALGEDSVTRTGTTFFFNLPEFIPDI